MNDLNLKTGFDFKVIASRHHVIRDLYPYRAFPGGSVSKESTCNVGDLGWEDPLEEGMSTHSSILAWSIPVDRRTWHTTVQGHKESDTTE